MMLPAFCLLANFSMKVPPYFPTMFKLNVHKITITSSFIAQLQADEFAGGPISVRFFFALARFVKPDQVCFHYPYSIEQFRG